MTTAALLDHPTTTRLCPACEWELLHPLTGPPRLTLSRPCPAHEEHQ